MSRWVSVAQVRSYAATRDTLNAGKLKRRFGITYDQAERLLARAARAPAPEELIPLSAAEQALARKYGFSASEARAAQKLIITGEIHHG